MVPVTCHNVAAPPTEANFIEKPRDGGKFLSDKRKFLQADAEPSLSLLNEAHHLWKILTEEVIWSENSRGLVTINSACGWTPETD